MRKPTLRLRTFLESARSVAAANAFNGTLEIAPKRIGSDLMAKKKNIGDGASKIDTLSGLL